LTPFSFHRPATLNDAVGVLAEAGPNAKVIAGGQSLLLALKERHVRPSSVISIADLPGLKGITQNSDGSLEIGSCTTYAKLAKAELPGWQSEIAAVAGNLADRSVRSMGTIGGAVCEAGVRFDMPVLLSGLAAKFKLASARGTRELEADAFFNPAGGTNVAPDEILTTITVPALSYWSRVAFEKFKFRTFDAAIVTTAGAVAFAPDGTIERLRVVIGGISKSPTVAVSSIISLKGRSLGAVPLGELAKRISCEALPVEKAITRSQKYQSELAISLVARTLTRLVTGATA
jgi:carbon-monoxide dehydrogenase medium subunit